MSKQAKIIVTNYESKNSKSPTISTDGAQFSDQKNQKQVLKHKYS